MHTRIFVQETPLTRRILSLALNTISVIRVKERSCLSYRRTAFCAAKYTGDREFMYQIRSLISIRPRNTIRLHVLPLAPPPRRSNPGLRSSGGPSGNRCEAARVSGSRRARRRRGTAADRRGGRRRTCHVHASCSPDRCVASRSAPDAVVTSACLSPRAPSTPTDYAAA